MGELLRELQRELKLPTVLVTHDTAEAASLADTVILYANGQVIRQGAPREVVTCPTGTGDRQRQPAKVPNKHTKATLSTINIS